MKTIYSGIGMATLTALVWLGWLTPAFGQQITSVDPPFGSPGEAVIIMGTGLAGGKLEVRFGGPLGAIDSTARAVSAQTVYAKVPPGAVTGPIYIKVGNQSFTTLEDFLVLGRGPFLTGFSPAYGAVSDTVILTGWHLTNTTSVKFGGKPATSFMPNAAGSQLTTRVPPGATNGPITVTTIFGTSNTPAPFTVIGPGPYIAAFSPLVVTPGETVTLEGAHFTGVTSVNFNGQPGHNLFVQSDILLRVDAPQQVANGLISVASPLGRHTNSQMYFVPPAITSFSPTQAVADVNLTIRGSNFLGALSVTIGGVNAEILSANNTNLVVIVPEGGRSGPVRVNTPAGSAFTTNHFRYFPVITSFSPNAGGIGTSVTINGRNLDEGLKSISFGGLNSTTNAILSPQQVVAKVPANAVTSKLAVTTTNGTANSDGYFYLPPSLTRSSASNAANTTITLFGSNLLGTTNVSFNGIEAAFVPPVTNSQLSVNVPPGFITGAIRVGTPGGEAFLGPFYGVPVISGFNPTHGLPGTEVTLTGTNFLGVTAASVGGAPITHYTVNTNGGVIMLTVPTNAASGPITVTGPAGTAASTQPFTLDLFSDLEVTMQAAPAAAVFTGSNLVYTIDVANAGPAAAPGVVLTDVLPEGVTLRSNRVSQGTVSVNGRTITASLGTVSTSQTASLQVFVFPTAVGTLENVASVHSDYSDPVPANNTAAISTVVRPLAIVKIEPYSAEQWRITWPLALSNFTLQFAPQPRPGTTWSNLLTTPIVSGTNQFVIEPATQPSRFYRLKDSQ